MKWLAAFTMIFFNLPVISWCKKRNRHFYLNLRMSNSTTHNQKAVIWLAGFTELFNWFLSLNSIDSLQFPMWKGWIFLLADDTGATEQKKQQQQYVCSGGRKTPQQKNITQTLAALVLLYNSDNRGCRVQEIQRRAHLSELVSQWR